MLFVIIYLLVIFPRDLHSGNISEFGVIFPRDLEIYLSLGKFHKLCELFLVKDNHNGSSTGDDHFSLGLQDVKHLLDRMLSPARVLLRID